MSSSRNYKEEVLTSKFAREIYRQILMEEAQYTTAIADALDSKPQSVSNYIKGLRERNLISLKEKKGRVKIYQANLDELFPLWKELWFGEDNPLERRLDKLDIDEKTKDEVQIKSRFFVTTYLIHRITTGEAYAFEEEMRGGWVNQVIHNLEPVYLYLPEWLQVFLVLHQADPEKETSDQESVEFAISNSDTEPNYRELINRLKEDEDKPSTHNIRDEILDED